MEQNQYAVIAGAILSVLFFYLPGLNTWYEKLASDQKQLIMLAAIFVAVFGRLGLACLGKDAAFACTYDGAWDALVQFVVAIIANAGVYKATNYIKKLQ